MQDYGFLKVEPMLKVMLIHAVDLACWLPLRQYPSYVEKDCFLHCFLCCAGHWFFCFYILFHTRVYEAQDATHQ